MGLLPGLDAYTFTTSVSHADPCPGAINAANGNSCKNIMYRTVLREVFGGRIEAGGLQLLIFVSLSAEALSLLSDDLIGTRRGRCS